MKKVFVPVVAFAFAIFLTLYIGINPAKGEEKKSGKGFDAKEAELKIEKGKLIK